MRTGRGDPPVRFDSCGRVAVRRSHGVGRVLSCRRVMCVCACVVFSTRARRDNLQVVVISLKDAFYNKADALVGVYKDQAKQASAHITIDLTKYDA
jgi:hypothetical protein